jgi:hypothetical protein
MFFLTGDPCPADWEGQASGAAKPGAAALGALTPGAAPNHSKTPTNHEGEHMNEKYRPGSLPEERAAIESFKALGERFNEAVAKHKEIAEKQDRLSELASQVNDEARNLSEKFRETIKSGGNDVETIAKLRGQMRESLETAEIYAESARACEREANLAKINAGDLSGAATTLRGSILTMIAENALKASLTGLDDLFVGIRLFELSINRLDTRITANPAVVDQLDYAIKEVQTEIRLRYKDWIIRQEGMALEDLFPELFGQFEFHQYPKMSPAQKHVADSAVR